LLDPWLTGDLVFGGQTWLFRGIKPNTFQLPEKIDLILLSQGLEDHCHLPTLEQLNRQIPIVASPNAAKNVEKLGYSQVNSLEIGQSYCLDDQITITAFAGSQLGPNLTENAYVLKDLNTQHSLYYEPHGNHSPELSKISPIDVILTPIVDFTLLNFVTVLKGQENTLKLCQMLNPRLILPTSQAQDTQYEGVLSKILRESGTIENFRQLLAGNNLSTQVICPQAYQTVELPLPQVTLS
jgi:L-ascorbate metabolism protein UlaG (beta-lactamase superfamily)